MVKYALHNSFHRKLYNSITIYIHLLTAYILGLSVFVYVSIVIYSMSEFIYVCFTVFNVWLMTSYGSMSWK